MPGTDVIPSAQRQTHPKGALDAQIHQAISHLAECDCPVLIVGERGTGKRSVAKQIHALSRRARASYRELRCGDVNESDLLSALSSKGVVYLAEVSHLNLLLQELLVNSFFFAAKVPACRLVLGSSHELTDDVKAFRMREDFYHLFSTLTLRIPPLRHRRQEILSIAESLLLQYSKQFDRPRPELSPEIIDFLMEHNWPENLSELQTAMKALVVIGDQTFSLAALRASTPSLRANGQAKSASLKEATRSASIQVERQMISEVLSSTGGNRKRAADELGISYKALLYKIKQIGAEKPNGSKSVGETL